MEELLDEEGDDGDDNEDVGKLDLASFEGASVPNCMDADCFRFTGGVRP